MSTNRLKALGPAIAALALLIYVLAGWSAPLQPTFAQADRLQWQSAKVIAANPFAIALGASHTCALTTVGGIKCWGNNAAGQLGLGNTTEQDKPIALAGLIAGVTALAAGNEHTCAYANSTGFVQCWGSNAHGQLGDGGNVKQRLTPDANVPLPSRAAQIAAGAEHTCALLSTGAVYCWGNNADGQLNAVPSADNPNPIPMSNLGALALQVTAGAAHTCALLQNGLVRCWGSNAFGQLGANGSGGPVTVTGLPTDLLMIAAGAWHTCALSSRGTVWCWGHNDRGQLGNGGQDDQITPVQVLGLSGNLSAISLGDRHSCALRNGGRVLCWGNNADGALGDDTGSDSSRAVEALGLRDAQIVAAGGRHTCALVSDGSLQCWGRNFNGQLGNGENGRHVLPVDVVDLLAFGDSVQSLVTASNHTCARVSGAVKCWGLNDRGQLGDGTRINRNAPVSVQNLPGGARLLTADGHHTCAATAVAAYCWGSNSDGQLGDGSTQDRLTPVQVLDLGFNISGMVIGDFHTCALLFNGEVRCWGDNTYGQLGDGSTQDRARPVAVTGLDAPATSISAGATHSCARLNTGVVKCWGGNAFGQLGNGNRTSSLTPVVVQGFDSGGAAAVHASETHTCARTIGRNGSGGRVRCWGSNTFGQLGNGSTTDSLVPATVPDLFDVSGVSVGRFHTCAMSAGVFKCWGSNAFGQLGDGSLIDRTLPVPVSGLGGSIGGYGAGGGQSCAILDGLMLCWGSDEYGQIGDGGPVDQFAPVGVLDFVEPQPEATDTPIALPTATVNPTLTTATITPFPLETATVTTTPSQATATVITGTPRKPTSTPRVTRTPTGEVLPPQPSESYLPAVLKQEAVFFEGPNEVEPNNNSGVPNGPLRASQIYTGLANDADDYFFINVTQSGPVTIMLSNHVAENTRNLQLQLRNSDDTSLGFVFQKPFVLQRTLSPGRYFIRIFYAPTGPFDFSTPYRLQADFR